VKCFTKLKKPAKHRQPVFFQESVMSKQVEGTVKWFNDEKRFGFIEQSDSRDVFVHYSAFFDDGRRTLVEGQKIMMKITQAENVSPANSD